MSDDRKPLWPWLAALLLGLPVLYVASFGPACWVSARVPALHSGFDQVYWPLGWMAVRGPYIVRRAIWSYASIGLPTDAVVSLPIGPDGPTALSICQHE